MLLHLYLLGSRRFSPSHIQCGKGPFARVARAWTPEDQSIPNPVVARLRRRDGTIPTVRALSLDTQFNRTSDMCVYVSISLAPTNV